MAIFVAVFLVAAVVSVLTTAVVIRTAKAFDLFDLPGIRKLHRGATPRLGGVAIAVACTAGAVPFLAGHGALPAILAYGTAIADSFATVGRPLVALFSASIFIFLVGLVDDVCGLRARTKLAAQLVAGLFLCGFGVRLEQISLSPALTIELGWLSWPLSLLWIVGVTNALNLIDGLDGLAGGIAAVACVVTAVVAVHVGQWITVLLLLSLLGGVGGFLVYNAHPARIFMGDGGSLFLGFMLAGSAVIIASAHEGATLAAFLPTALALGVPILDTLCSMLRRILSRRSLFAPDRNHIHHRLVDLGLSQQKVVIVLHSVTVIAGGLGMFLLLSHEAEVLFVALGVLLLLGVFFRAVGSIRLRESMAVLNNNMAIARQFKEDRRDFEDAQLHVCAVRTFDQWWQALAEVARSLHCAWIALDIASRDGTASTLVWRHPEWDPSCGGHTLTATIPVRDRRTGPPLKLQVVTEVEESLEVTGRRIMLFSQLLDAHGLASLPEESRRSVRTAPVPSLHPTSMTGPGRKAASRA
ncbi:MAG TPA: MraY family glycosyltransferase [Phycisphaerae bacterium]|nr:MraY family glycosyltransferase [Phycisphaerae bacterium]HRY70643.1 MraY family glycosyltransferase [Phycisphaerae bacterium]HSA28958.1 MraY family glycosyltransferase [Phycisphaerae bacterium]